MAGGAAATRVERICPGAIVTDRGASFYRTPIMKKLLATAAMGLATLGFATSASAFQFTPRNTSFTATGSVTLTTPTTSVPCRANLQLNTLTMGATVTSASFSGDPRCSSLQAGGLPWHMSTGSPHSLQILQVDLSSVALGNCGPSTVPAQDTDKGKIIITSAGLHGSGQYCTLSGTFMTTPHLVITGK